ncbi:MAG: hypothetical protein WCC37_02605, partial [Candidatus Sulfotelmatobacter sp.]
RASAFGSLTHYVTHAGAKNFQPANITFDLLPPLEKKIRDRKERHRMQCELALKAFEEWMEWIGAAAVRRTDEGPNGLFDTALFTMEKAISPRN